MKKIKLLIASLSLLLIGGVTFAQNGLERVIVERYYTSNAADATGSIGALPAGSVTYRVFADMIPGYKFQAMYGVAAHPLTISTTTAFFNNQDRGAITPNGIATQYINDNSVAIDSWFSAGATATGQVGVLKSEDNGAANLITGNTMLLNNDGDSGIPLTTQDGMMTGTTQAVTFVGITAGQQSIFDATSNLGNSITTSNGSIASLNGTTGPTATNRVLIGQFTTDGNFHFNLNIQVGTGVAGQYQSFVSSNPTGNEIMLPSLTFDSYIAPPTVNSPVTYCVGATASALTATAIAGDTLRWYTTATGGTGSLTAPTPSTATAGTTTYYVSQFKGSSLSPRAAVVVNVNATPITIVNSPSLCLGASATLTASGATSYSWSQGGTGATSTVTPTATTTYTVTGTTNGCSSTAVATATVTVSMATPGTITGTAAVCAYVGTSTSVNYHFTAVAGASTYVWTVPAGVSIVSGQGTTSLNVSYQNTPVGAMSGNISVVAVSAAGCMSLPKTYAITSTLPLVPTTCAGTSAICAYEGTTTPLTYTCSGGTGALSYQWTVPGAVNLLSGQGTSSITANYANVSGSGALGNISVAGVSGCGTGPAKTLAISATIPAIPGVITGPTTVCAYVATSTPVTYTIVAVTGALSYNWVVPAGVNVVSGQGTTALTVNYSAIPTGAGTIGAMTVQSVSNCGTSAVRSVTLTKGVPVAPTSITGPLAVCSYVGTTTTATYSCANIVNATGYTWTVPAGVNIISGQNTNSITVDFQGVTYGAGTVGTLSVMATAPCGNSALKTITLTKTAVATPTAITGQFSDLCYANTYNYSVPVNALATSYVWTVPTNAVINSGQGTTQINVTFNTGYLTGAVTCKNSNACSISAAKSVTVTAGPAAPVAITGSSNACASMQSSTPNTYSIAPVTGALSYLWTVPANATLISGQGTTSVSVQFASNFVSGTLSVASQGTCITSAAKTLIIYKVPGLPSTITGNTSICAEVAGGIPVSYSIAPIVGATSYNWTLPAGATIVSGAGTSAISVLFAVNTPAGSLVRVASVNACGTSSLRSTAGLVTCASPIEIGGVDNANGGSTFSELYPNPATDFLNFDVTSDINKDVLVQVYNVLGAEVINQKYAVVTGTTSLKTDVSGLHNGVFMVRLTDLSNSITITKSMVK